MSDLHMELGPVHMAKQATDVVVLAGDIHRGQEGVKWAQKTFVDTPVIYVAGNHEFYEGDWVRTLDDLRSAADGTNVYFLEDAEAVIQGVRFLGASLWTDFKLLGAERQSEALIEARMKMNDFRLITGPAAGSILEGEAARLLPIHTAHRFERSAAFLWGKLNETFPGPTVLVTHHAPHPRSIPDQFKNRLITTAYASDLSVLMGESLDLWIHGHIHRCKDFFVGNTRVVCNPRGYPGRYGKPGNQVFDPSLIVQLANESWRTR